MERTWKHTICRSCPNGIAMDFQGVSWSDSGLHHDMHDMPYASELQYLKFDARSVWISRKWQEMEWNEQPQVIHQIYDHCQLSSHSDYPRGGWKNNLGLSQQELSFSQQICETSRAGSNQHRSISADFCCLKTVIRHSVLLSSNSTWLDCFNSSKDGKKYTILYNPIPLYDIMVPKIGDFIPSTKAPWFLGGRERWSLYLPAGNICCFSRRLRVEKPKLGWFSRKKHGFSRGTFVASWFLWHTESCSNSHLHGETAISCGWPMP